MVLRSAREIVSLATGQTLQFADGYGLAVKSDAQKFAVLVGKHRSEGFHGREPDAGSSAPGLCSPRAMAMVCARMASMGMSPGRC
jgi:hypothetical protein